MAVLASRIAFALVLCCTLASIAPTALADVELLVGPAAMGGQYATIQAAVDAVPASNTVRHVIKILPGEYRARVIIPDNKPLITMRGLGRNPGDTVIVFNETQNTPPNESTVHATTVIRSRDFIGENLTFANDAGESAGVALAIYVRGDRAIFNDCRFLGWQDTLRSESGRHYFYKSYVEGKTDFIYGKGTAYFEEATLYPLKGGYITAQGREQAAETNGYVFKNATITGSAPNNSVYLGRPWQAYSRSIFIDSQMGPAVHTAGWSQWSGNNNHLTAYFAEHNSDDLNGNDLNVSGRPSWTHQLTAAQIAPYSKQNWLAGSDGWNPVASNTPAPLADFNGDEVVTGADFLIWQSGFGLTGQSGNANGDADFDGDVDFIDRAVWEYQYGQTFSTNSFAVPEPGSTALASILLLMATRCSRPARGALRR